jgi:hypothetical protein
MDRYRAPRHISGTQGHYEVVLNVFWRIKNPHFDLPEELFCLREGENYYLLFLVTFLCITLQKGKLDLKAMFVVLNKPLQKSVLYFPDFHAISK